MAKIAQEQFLVQLRPVLTTSRREDPPLKVNFGDTKWVRIPGGGAVGEVGPGDGSMGPDTLAREPWTVELLYGDHEGGQRVVSRFTMLPIKDPSARSSDSPSASPSDSPSAGPDVSPDRTPELGWLATASRHWNIDRPDPR
jgi:hypothetical protein